MKSIGFVAQKCIESNNNKEIENGFIKLMDALYEFGNGENIEPFSLSLVNQNSDSKAYIDFCFESNTIEISKGGYIFEDGMVGDSYSDWMCTFWNSGDISDYEDLDISEIKEMISEGTEVSLTLPDEDVIKVELSK